MDNGGWLSTLSIILLSIIMILGISFAIYQDSKNESQIEINIYEVSQPNS